MRWWCSLVCRSLASSAHPGCAPHPDPGHTLQGTTQRAACHSPHPSAECRPFLPFPRLTRAALATSQAFNELLRACSRDRAGDKAVDVFEHMQRLHVLASTETYNALVHACYRSSQPGKVRLEGPMHAAQMTIDMAHVDTLLQGHHARHA